MSENHLIYRIRQNKRLSKMFDKLTTEQKRDVLYIADGDDWHLEEIIEFVREGK